MPILNHSITKANRTTMDQPAEATRQLVRLRGRSYVAYVFCPAVPIAGWLDDIDRTLNGSPGFFVGRPVVLDLAAVDLSPQAIAHLVANLEQRQIRVLGIEGVDAAQGFDVTWFDQCPSLDRFRLSPRFLSARARVAERAAEVRRGLAL